MEKQIDKPRKRPASYRPWEAPRPFGSFRRIQERTKINDNIEEEVKVIEMNAYTKTEVDLKLENLEQKIDGKLDKVLSEIQHFNVRLDDFWKILIGVFVPIMAGIIFIIIQNSYHHEKAQDINIYQPSPVQTREPS